MRWMGLVLLTALAVSLGSCSEEPEYSEAQRVCISQRYRDYDGKHLGQCVDVCRSCMRGTIATCNASCKLKGAS
jgi:hypothetical protein